MANEIAITVRAHDQASGVMSSIRQSAGGLGESLSRVGQIAAGFVIGQGLTRLPGLLTDMVQAAADDEASTLRLRQAVENSGASWDAYKGRLEGVISTAQRRGYTDDQARNSLSLLEAQTGDTEEAMRRFALAQDLARGANIDLETASRLLGRATDENVNVLRRMGITLRDGATEADLFAAVQQRFGGQSEQFANSTAGHFAAVKIQMQELKERIGYQLLPVMTALGSVLVNNIVPAANALGDAIGALVHGDLDSFHDSMVTVLTDLGIGQQKAEALADTFTEWADFIRNEVAPVLRGELGAALTQLTQLFEGLKPLVEEVTRFIGEHKEAQIALAIAAGVLVAALLPIPVGIIAIIAAGTLLLAHWDDIRAEIDRQIAKFEEIKDEILSIPVVGPVVQAAFDAIVLTITSAFEFLIGYIQAQIDFIRGIFTLGLDLIHGDFGKFWTDLKALLSTMFSDIIGLFDTQLAYIKGMIGIYLTAWVGVVSDGASEMFNAGQTLVGGILQGANSMVGYLARFFSELPGNILSWMGDIGSLLANAVLGSFRGAWNAAAGQINNAIPNKISIPGPLPDIDLPDNPIPYLAAGGIVRARPGGVLALLAEGGRDEAVIPLERGRATVAAPTGMTVNLTYAPTFSSASSVEAQKFLRWIADGLRPIWGRATA